MKVDILAIGVHPDDVELCASGTILKHLDLGYTVAICDLTQGELGTRGSGPLRLQEAEKAKQILGISHRENLGMADGFFQHNEENIKKIAKVIRKYKPEIVLANAVTDRHPDHGRASKLISDACFYAGLVKIETRDDEGLIQSAWRPKAVYHYIQDRNLKADFVVDITQYLDKKIESIMAYSSQFFDPESKEPETPISSKAFIDYMKAKNRAYGRDIGAEYAEAFTVERNMGVKNLFDLV
ncbi:MAG TPA: bacillithiol biosynthesis deacetylase BshB1 [Saprospiraceae bacterium]|jgi:bacillithiol biosynthesis deacetylase BshB1|nr:bacillithiol biosynthesis deacetylase BshB1 [Saprospiraceae bacterium]MBK7699532.1 bacillithiol biosynthesis deacetylase BshB1 [Saprospiraceae bacterium]MBP6539506.1 bacillithiol biosynthesis deacetylase BshB1 [Saprospiraceae bacterium]HMT52883.1 bacillithiol biosynthesis deacetylase BshB1 [Saprospiraceae bacterium]HMT69818.1 bacillithiol biosynthesis deacetylase BshB1 [Saprospiraceae bacterium]